MRSTNSDAGMQTEYAEISTGSSDQSLHRPQARGRRPGRQAGLVLRGAREEVDSVAQRIGNEGESGGEDGVRNGEGGARVLWKMAENAGHDLRWEGLQLGWGSPGAVFVL